jgi:hypothetical protein
VVKVKKTKIISFVHSGKIWTKNLGSQNEDKKF